MMSTRDGKENNRRTYPYGGWIVVLACFGINTIMLGYIKCFGILFVEFVEAFDASASLTSLIMGLTSASTSIMSLVVLNALADRFPTRILAVCGAVCASSGVMLTSGASNIYFLLFSHSMLIGCAQGLLYGPGVVLIGKYFDERRTLATAIGTSGVSAGAVLLPLLLRYLLDEYGLQGALLMMSGVMMQMFVLAGLYKEPENKNSDTASSDSISRLCDCHNENINIALNREKVPLTFSIDYIDSGCDKQRDFSSISNNANDLNEDYITSDEYRCRDFKMDETNDTVSSGLRGSKESVTNDDTDDEVYNYEPNAQVRIESDIDHSKPDHVFLTSFERQSSVTKSNSFNRSAIDKTEKYDHKIHVRKEGAPSYLSRTCASNTDALCASTFSLQTEIKACPLTSHTPEPRHGFLALIKENLRLFTDARFLIIFGFTFFGIIGTCLFPAFIPPLAREKNLSDVEATLFIIVFACCDFISRLVAGLVAGHSCVNIRYMLVGMFLILGVIYQFTEFYTSYQSMLVFVVTFSLLNGIYAAVHPPLILSLLGRDHFSRVFGFVQVFHGAALSVSFPILGYIRDVTGTYTMSFHLLGASQFAAAVVLLLEPLSRTTRQHHAMQ